MKTSIKSELLVRDSTGVRPANPKTDKTGTFRQWRVYRDNEPVQTFPTRKQARHYAHNLRTGAITFRQGREVLR